jgi:transcriptional regulator of aromatic amino acid metabolism
MMGTKTMMTQAPRMAPAGLNLVMAMTTSTTRERKAPVALMNSPRFQPGSFLVMWCLAMPAWERVNEVNTPMA